MSAQKEHETKPVTGPEATSLALKFSMEQLRKRMLWINVTRITLALLGVAGMCAVVALLYLGATRQIAFTPTLHHTVHYVAVALVVGWMIFSEITSYGHVVEEAGTARQMAQLMRQVMPPRARIDRPSTKNLGLTFAPDMRQVIEELALTLNRTPGEVVNDAILQTARIHELLTTGTGTRCLAIIEDMKPIVGLNLKVGVPQPAPPMVEIKDEPVTLGKLYDARAFFAARKAKNERKPDAP